MKRIALALVMLPTMAIDAKAQHFICNPVSAPAVVKCVHPTATFTACQPIDDLSAKIFFKGGIVGRPYEMDVTSEINGNFSRTIVLRDSAAGNQLAPSGCQPEAWQPIIRY